VRVASGWWGRSCVHVSI